MRARVLLTAALLGIVGASPWVLGNGGPFVIKYPSGDPAAKGVLARLEPTLKPARETRLRVVKEDLTIDFQGEHWRGNAALPPKVAVSAAYTIENPTDKEIQIDFGFPILRGIYLIQGMGLYPDAHVMIDNAYVQATVISNSVIFGLIRQNARNVIEKGIAGDAEFARRVAAVRAAWVTVPPPAPPKPPVAPPAPKQTSQKRPATAKAPKATIPGRATLGTDLSPYIVATPATKADRNPTAAYRPAREDLQEYLTTNLHWNPRDAALLVELASLDLKPVKNSWDTPQPHDSWSSHVWMGQESDTVKTSNLGVLAAIGEQKATQMFAQLASRFDKGAGVGYEAIFAAWGGDVRERSIDMATGQLRPREVTLSTPKAADATPGRRKPGDPIPVDDRRLTADPTVFARVDYLDPRAKLSPEEKASCEAVLKNLPVVFTFAPMNLLHYQVKFPAKSKRVVNVKYGQYAYADTRGTGSYQLAYVLHPATFWNEFGPIHLTITVPRGIACKASVDLRKTGEKLAELTKSENGRVTVPVGPRPVGRPASPDYYEATLSEPSQKSGELFVAVDKTAWDKMYPPVIRPASPPVMTGLPGHALQKSGAGTLILNGGGGYTGSTVIKGGVLQISPSPKGNQSSPSLKEAPKP